MSDETKPNMGKVTVKFGATVPMMDFGNFTLDVTWEGEATPDDTKGIIEQTRLTVGQGVLPIVQEQIDRATEQGRFKDVDNPEKYWMTVSKPYYWLRTVCPEIVVNIPAPRMAASPAPAQPAATPLDPAEDVEAQLAALGIPTVLATGTVESPAKPKGNTRQQMPRPSTSKPAAPARQQNRIK